MVRDENILGLSAEASKSISSLKLEANNIRYICFTFRMVTLQKSSPLLTRTLFVFRTGKSYGVIIIELKRYIALSLVFLENTPVRACFTGTICHGEPHSGIYIVAHRDRIRC